MVEESKEANSTLTVEEEFEKFKQSKEYLEEKRKRQEERKAFNDSITATIQGAGSFQQKWESYENNFSEVMKNLAVKMMSG